MKTKLTPAFVQKAPAPERGDRVVYWDEGLPCFGLMVTATGHRSFVVQYRASGVSRRLTLKAAPHGGLSLNEAKREAKAIIGDVTRGSDPLGKRRKEAIAAENTLRSIADEFLSRDGARLRSHRQMRSTLERLVYPRLGARQIGDIRRSEIVKLLDKIADENGPVQADMTLSFLRRVMNWHAGRSDDFRSPIVRGMAKTKASQRRRQRILNDDELRAVWRAAEAQATPLNCLVQFLLLTATRRNEAARMERGELSGAEWIIPERRYKNGLQLLVPLSPAAQAILDKTPHLSDRFIFTNDGKHALASFSKFKPRLDEASGVTGWTLHDLRRTARSLMSRAGVSADIAERCLGHVMGNLRAIYDRHQYADEKRRAFEALANLVGRIVDPRANVTPLRRS
jgi:integrase